MSVTNMTTNTDALFPLSWELILLSHILFFGLFLWYNKKVVNVQKHNVNIESNMQSTAQYIFP